MCPHLSFLAYVISSRQIIQVLSTPAGRSAGAFTSGSFFNFDINCLDWINSWIDLPNLTKVSIISLRRYSGNCCLEMMYMKSLMLRSKTMKSKTNDTMLNTNPFSVHCSRWYNSNREIVYLKLSYIAFKRSLTNYNTCQKLFCTYLKTNNDIDLVHLLATSLEPLVECVADDKIRNNQDHI